MPEFLPVLKRTLAKRIYKFIKYWAIDYNESQAVVMAAYRASGMRLGENVVIYNSDVEPLYPYLITMGDNVTVTNATILAHDDSPVLWHKRRRLAPVTIGSNVFVGHHSLILPGVTIGSNCIIGAGSIVAKDVPDNCVVAGNPAHVIKTIDEYKEKTLSSGDLVNLEVESNFVTGDEDQEMTRLALLRFRPDLQ